MVANDTDSTLLPQELILPLPQDDGSRARVILGKLLDLYALPDSTHPVTGGAASIGQVFLLPAINSNPSPATAVRLASSPASTTHGASASHSAIMVKNAATTPPKESSELAVVNLTSAFVASHPSGIETETLTVLSICGTLHTNLPRVTRFDFSWTVNPAPLWPDTPTSPAPISPRMPRRMRTRDV